MNTITTLESEAIANFWIVIVVTIIILFIFVFLTYYFWGGTTGSIFLILSIILIISLILFIVLVEFTMGPVLPPVGPTNPPIIPPILPPTNPSNPPQDNSVKYGDILTLQNVSNNLISAGVCYPPSQSNGPGFTVSAGGVDKQVKNWKILGPGKAIGSQVRYNDIISLVNVNPSFPQNNIAIFLGTIFPRAVVYNQGDNFTMTINKITGLPSTDVLNYRDLFVLSINAGGTTLNLDVNKNDLLGMNSNCGFFLDFLPGSFTSPDQWQFSKT